MQPHRSDEQAQVVSLKGANDEKSAPVSQEASRVYRLIAKRDYKSAIYEAKALYKRRPGGEAETLLVGAYTARIRDLVEKSLISEAKSLMDMVREQFPSGRERMAELTQLLAVRSGNLDDLVRPLNDPAMPEDTRRAIEETLKREVTDLGRLAECRILAEDHPLRRGARAILDALTRVTEGTVGDEVTGLEGISHRSPLAPWKLLVRAIAAFYRREDDRCEKILAMIDPDSAPARLAPALRAMIGRKHESLSPAVASLVRQVRVTAEPLREALARLESHLAKKDRNKILAAVEQVVRECRAFCPDRLERLKQHVSIRCHLADVPADRVAAAMGGPSLHDAYFFRLLARAKEARGDPLMANSLWEEFRRNALCEGWFAPFGAEEASLFMHMAENLMRIRSVDLAIAQNRFRQVFTGHQVYYQDQPPSVREAAPKGKPDFYFLYPDQLYQRASHGHKDPELYRLWFERSEADSEKETAAMAWHRAFPADARPLLHLMAVAEKRNAFKKAIGYLEKAEQIDALNTEVRRARLRLMVSAVLRHLRQKKPHLARKGLQEIARLPQSQEGRRPAFLGALRALTAMLEGRDEDMRRELDDAGEHLNSVLAGRVTFHNLARICGAETRDDLLPRVGEFLDTNLAKGVADACAAGVEMKVLFQIPGIYVAPLEKYFSRHESALDVSDLRFLAGAAINGDHRKLAYMVSGQGLRRGGPETARFLYLRGRSLPEWMPNRQDECLLAAVHMARRDRNQVLVDTVMETLHAIGFGDVEGMDLEKVFRDDPKRTETVVAREKDAVSYPKRSDPDVAWEGDEFFPEDFDEDDDWEDVDDSCQCPDCRRRRKQQGGGQGRAGLPRELIPPELRDCPPEMMEVLVEMMMRHPDRLPTRAETDRLFRDRPELLEIMLRNLDYLDRFAPGGGFGPGPRSRKTKRKR